MNLLFHRFCSSMHARTHRRTQASTRARPHARAHASLANKVQLVFSVQIRACLIRLNALSICIYLKVFLYVASVASTMRVFLCCA